MENFVTAKWKEADMLEELTIYVLAIMVGLLAGLGVARPPLGRAKPESRL